MSVSAPAATAVTQNTRLHGLNRYLASYNHDRAHTGRLTRGAHPADIVDSARKLENAS